MYKLKIKNEKRKRTEKRIGESRKKRRDKENGEVPTVVHIERKKQHICMQRKEIRYKHACMLKRKVYFMYMWCQNSYIKKNKKGTQSV